MAEKKWLVTLLTVKEEQLKQDGFPEGRELSSLPDLLNAAVEGLSPSQALEFQSAYLLTDEHKEKVIQYLEKNSLPYHEYAVGVRNERCEDPDCTEHYKCVVIKLHDRRQSREGAGEATPEE